MYRSDNFKDMLKIKFIIQTDTAEYIYILYIIKLQTYRDLDKEICHFLLLSFCSVLLL
jgi:hypothetical protein